MLLRVGKVGSPFSIFLLVHTCIMCFFQSTLAPTEERLEIQEEEELQVGAWRGGGGG